MRFFSTLLYCSFVFLHAQPALAENKPIILIVADEWCPINCVPNTEEEGVAIDLARAIFEPEGYEIRYETMPWARALKETRRGETTAVVGAMKKDAPDFVYPDHPISPISDDFYMLKEHKTRFTELASLAKLKVGIITDYAYSDETTQALHTTISDPFMVQTVSGDDALAKNIAKLLNGRIDVVVESAPVMQYTLEKKHLNEKIIRVGSTKSDNIYMAFSPALKNAPALAALYDAGYKKLKQEGKLTPLYKKYGLTHKQ